MMKKLAALLALALCLGAAPGPATAATDIPGVKVAATATNTATDFAADVTGLCIDNAGANEIHYALGAAAVATTGVNEIAPGKVVCWDDLDFATTTAAGARSAIVGIICATDETSTVYLFAVTR